MCLLFLGQCSCTQHKVSDVKVSNACVHSCAMSTKLHNEDSKNAKKALSIRLHVAIKYMSKVANAH